MAYDPSLRRKCLASYERRVTSSSRIGALLYPPFSQALLPLPAFPLLKSPLPSDFSQTDRYAHRPQPNEKPPALYGTGLAVFHRLGTVEAP